MSWAQNQQLTVVCVGFVLSTGKSRVSEDLCACAQWGPGRSAGGSTRRTSSWASPRPSRSRHSPGPATHPQGDPGPPPAGARGLTLVRPQAQPWLPPCEACSQAAEMVLQSLQGGEGAGIRAAVGWGQPFLAEGTRRQHTCGDRCCLQGNPSPETRDLCAGPLPPPRWLWV